MNMLDYREHMRNYEERVNKIARDHERLRMWTYAYPSQPSPLRQVIAQIGSALVSIGSRLQTQEQRQRLLAKQTRLA
jgi:hypothetical protein